MLQDKRLNNKTTNDPISDFLTRIRNALLINSQTVIIPFSKVKLHLTEILKQEGYVNSFKVVNEDIIQKKGIEIELKYNEDGQPTISGLRRISRPGLRKYSKGKEAPRVFNGLGISIVSTNKGLKTDRGCRKDKIGGEVLCQVW